MQWPHATLLMVLCGAPYGPPLSSLSLSQTVVERFSAALHSESAGAILGTATNWEELEIQEEAESGNSVVSKIRLPVQVSKTSEDSGVSSVVCC